MRGRLQLTISEHTRVQTQGSEGASIQSTGGGLLQQGCRQLQVLLFALEIPQGRIHQQQQHIASNHREQSGGLKPTAQ